MFRDLKPYPEYAEPRSPWIPAFPSTWSVAPGAGVLQEVRAKNYGLRETTVLSLSYGRVIVKSDDKLHGLVPASFEGYQILEPGDIVIRPTDLQNDQTSLRVGAVQNHGIITSAYIGLRPRHIDDWFAFLYLKALDHLKVFYGMGSGLRQNLDFSDFKRLPVPMPTMEEQNAIVTYLAHAHQRINEAIAAKLRLISLLDEQRQVTISSAVTRGLDPGVELRDSGIPWLGPVPAPWATTCVKRLFKSMVYGTSESSAGGGPVTALGMGDIKDGRVRPVRRGGLARIDQGLEMRPGDILFNRTNSPALVGKVGLFDGDPKDLTFASYLVRCRVTSEHDPVWATHFLSSHRFLGFARSQALVSLHQANLSSSRWGGLPVVVPSLPEQRAIVDHIERANVLASREISNAQREVELLLEFRTRLTADVATGQLDVRAVAAALPRTDPAAVYTASSADACEDDAEALDGDGPGGGLSGVADE